MQNQKIQKRKSSFPAAVLTIVMLVFVSLGCSDFMKGFKEGYDNSRGTTSNTSSDNKDMTNAAKSTPEDDSPSQSKLEKDIVGKWEITNNGRTVGFDFSSDKKVETFIDGKSASKGTYKVVDEETIETTNTDGSVTETIPIKIEGDEMTMTYNSTKLKLTKQ